MSDENAEVSDRKSPGFWFYPADYERDMQLLPMAAQGLWMRILCWMHENEMHRGFLELPTGDPMTVQDIARRAGISVKETIRLLACMERIGTFSKDQRGCLLSRRMARDTHISGVRRLAAIKRASAVERAKTGEFAPAKQPIDGPAKVEQNPTVTASVSVTVTTEEEEPPNPPAPLALVLAPPTSNGHHRNGNKNRTSDEIRKALGPERQKWWDGFWAVFPCRDGMKAGMDAFERRIKTRDLAIEVFHGAERYAKQATSDPTLKLKYSQGWINGERWKDENRIQANGISRKPTIAENVIGIIEERIAKGEKPW